MKDKEEEGEKKLPKKGLTKVGEEKRGGSKRRSIWKGKKTQ